MAHNHDEPGHHHHAPVLTSVNRAFIIGIVLNFLFVVAEVIAGLYTHSLSLLSDAGHNLADVAALALSLLAFKLMKVRSSSRYTYGYRKTSILVALFNSMVLLFSIGAIVYEAIVRFLHPEPMQGSVIAIVAAIGILVNGSTALLFFRNKEKDINAQSAYLHLLSDAAVSFGLVVGGIVIYYTNWFWVDSMLSITVAAIIFFSTWRLLKDSLRLSLDGVPANVDVSGIEKTALSVAGVKEMHHIHVWALSSTENALTAHVVLAAGVTIQQEEQIKSRLKHDLLHINIHHATLETEREHATCSLPDC